MADRSFAGFTYQQRLSAGFFGEVFRAHNGTGQEARIIHVAPSLAAVPEFTRQLIAFGQQLSVLEHPRVVAVRTVGKSRDEELVVVTDAVSGPVTLADLLAGAPLPRDVAMAIGLGVVEGMAYAQSLGLVHGGIHPRSVLIDFHGGVRLADFGLAWALAGAAADGDDATLFHGLTGYVAPEQAIGHPPGPQSDVYCAGALLHHLLAGSPPPGPLETSPAIGAVIARALATDADERFVNGTELEEALEEAITRDGCRVAPADEVAALVSARLAARESTGRGPAPRPAGGLPLQPDASPALELGPAGRSPLAARRRGVTDILAGLESDGDATSVGDGDDDETAVAREELSQVGETQVEASTPDALGSTTELTQVDDGMAARTEPDPISEILKIPPARRGLVLASVAASDDERTPLPPPMPLDSTRSLDDSAGDEAEFRKWSSTSEHKALSAIAALAAEDTGQARLAGLATEDTDKAPAASPDPARVGLLETGPVPPPVAATQKLSVQDIGLADTMQASRAELLAEIARGRAAELAPVTPSMLSARRAPGRQAAIATDKVPAPDAPARKPARLRVGDEPLPEDVLRRPGRPLLWLAVIVFCLGGLGAVLYTQTDVFGRHGHAASDRLDRLDEQDERARLDAEQVHPGELVVSADVDGAAVWLSLGRAPTTSFVVPSNMVHELRLERDGFLPLDLAVTANQWAGDAAARVAQVGGSLVPGSPTGPIPAFPPEPESPRAPGPPGRGLIRVESAPPGAEVWLLIGTTPAATLSGVPAGKTYDLKVVKDGYRPAFATVKAEDWYLGGTPAGPIRPSVSRAVVLEPLPAPAPPPTRPHHHR